MKFELQTPIQRVILWMLIVRNLGCNNNTSGSETNETLDFIVKTMQGHPHLMQREGQQRVVHMRGGCGSGAFYLVPFL